MLTFLELNGHGVSATDRELADWIISFSAGATPADVAEHIRPRLTAATRAGVPPQRTNGRAWQRGPESVSPTVSQ